MSSRALEQVIDEIHRQRDELVSAVSVTRRDVTYEIARLKQVVKSGLPVAGAALGVLAFTLLARKLAHPSPKAPVVIERVRLGRFSLLERRV